MRRGAYVIFSIMLVLACCYITGCTSSPSGSSQQAQHGKVNVGVSFDNTSDEARNYSFEEVTSSIYLAPFNPITNEPLPSDETHILLISGENLNDKGNASSWLFIVQYQNSTKFVTYDQYGETIINWSGGYPPEEVFPDQVVPPGTLFEKNRDSIFKTPQAISTESRRLVLSGGTYTLTIKGQNNSRILVFDAKTGALNSSNDQ
jgi:hypothetical protein